MTDSNQTSTRYTVVFTGKLMNDADPAIVQQQFAQLFNIDVSKAQAILSKPTVLKKHLDVEQAEKYLATLSKLNIQVKLKKEPSAAAKVTAASAANQATTTLRLLPAGSDLLAQHERAQPQNSNIDTSQFKMASPFTITDPVTENTPPISAPDYSVAALGEDLLLLKPKHKIVDIKTIDFGLASAGSELLKPEEKTTSTATAPDTSHLQLEPN